MTMTLLDPPPVEIPVGGTVQLGIGAPGFFGRTEIQIELSDPPEGIAVDSVTRADQGLTVVLRGDSQKAKAGLKGNLIASAFSQTTWKTQGGKPQTTRWLVATLPAIPFEIVEPFERMESVKTHPYWLRFIRKDYLPAACGGCREAADWDGGCREAAHLTRGTLEGARPVVRRGRRVAQAATGDV